MIIATERDCGIEFLVNMIALFVVLIRWLISIDIFFTGVKKTSGNGKIEQVPNSMYKAPVLGALGGGGAAGELGQLKAVQSLRGPAL